MKSKGILRGLRVASWTAAAVAAAALTTLTGTPDAGAQTESCPSNSIKAQAANTVILAIDESRLATTRWGDGTVSIALLLQNFGNTPAANVSVQSLQGPPSSAYLGPSALPYGAGTIESGGRLRLSALFSSSPQQSHPKYPLIVKGTYAFGSLTCDFQAQTFVVPEAAGNGGTPKSTTTVERFTADTAIYPAAPLFHSPKDPRNAAFRYVPPLGPERYLFATPPQRSLIDETLAFSPNDQNPPAGGNASQVVFVRNAEGGTYSSLPPDPSVAGATPSGFTMISANSGGAAAVSFSTDYGKTFTTVNLTQLSGFTDPARPARTDFFPESDAGLCCDQVLLYVPGRNLMVWLMQYWSPNINVGGVTRRGQNRLRIAWSTPEAAAADFLGAWTWFDITPADLGSTSTTDWLDYPDLAYSNGWLYISVDHGFWNTATNAAGNEIGQQVFSNRRYFVRASLDDMVSSGGGIDLVYYEPIKNGVAKAHFVQSSPDTMYYAARPDSSTLSVFADPDSSDLIPTPTDVAITSSCAFTAINTCDYLVRAPDNVDWNVAPHSALGGAYVEPSQPLCPPEGCPLPPRYLYFAFDGGRDASEDRPFPYVRITKIDARSLGLIEEFDLWNDQFALATPALVSRPGSGRDEVAFSLARGGGTRYADNAVGFLGDGVIYVTTSSNATQTDGAGTARYGDYFSVRNAAGPVTLAGQGIGYSTLGYAVTQAVSGSSCAAAGCNVSLRYVLFGRNEELFPRPVQDPR